jgi:BMFP domain-containing protein YqiC
MATPPEQTPEGIRVYLAERFFDVEDRVAELGDDIETLKGLEARIAELGSKVERAMAEARRRTGPDEVTVRTWGREAAHAEVATLTRRVQAMESRPVARGDGGFRADLADLEQRVSAVEARPTHRGGAPGQDPAMKAKLDEIERACIRLGRRLATVEADLNKFALSFAQHVYSEAGGEDEEEEGEE